MGPPPPGSSHTKGWELLFFGIGCGHFFFGCRLRVLFWGGVDCVAKKRFKTLFFVLYVVCNSIFKIFSYTRHLCTYDQKKISELRLTQGGSGGWHKASVLGCLPLAVPIGLSPLLILTLCRSKRVFVVSREPLDDLSCLTTPGSAVPETGCCLCR